MNSYEITITRADARILLDYLLDAAPGTASEALTDALDEAQGEAADADARVVIIIQQGDL